MNGTRADGSTLISQNGAPIYSAFFQQSACDPCHRQPALCREGPQRRAARAARAVRLQRPDRRGRGVQLDAAAARRFICGVRRRRRRPVRHDGGENRRLRSDHRGRRPRQAAGARRGSSGATHTINNAGAHRRGVEDPVDHRRRRALLARDIRAGSRCCARPSRR